MKEEDLIKDGWEKIGIYNEPRLSEICELYRELGFDVLVIPYEGKFNHECGVCYDTDEKLEFKIVFPKRVKK